MVEIRTFSALVDDVVARSGRKDRVNDIIAYARTTLRECSVLDFFDQSLVEVQLTADGNPFLWQRPANLRGILAVRTPYYDRRNSRIFAKEKKPGVDITNIPYYFYLSGDIFVLVGFTAGDIIDMAYYTYTVPLQYYADVADRPARFNLETNLWEYHAAYTASDETKEDARNLVTNWLLEYWYDLIAEGVLSKLYKLVNDEARMRMSYALYKSGQKDLKAGESSAYVGKVYG